MSTPHPYPALARKTIERYLSTGLEPNHAERAALSDDLTDDPAVWSPRKGCFVSIKNKDGSLRGCIGTFMPTQKNLGEEIMVNAVSAAAHDPRFPPLQQKELDNIHISVDVLNEPERVLPGMQLDPKVYGVIVVKEGRRGLLLPDLEGVANVEQQLAIAAQKAGIRSLEGAEIYRFTVSRYKETGMMVEPRWWSSDYNKGEPVVTCGLCHHGCRIAEGKTGYCRVRANASGRLVSPWLGRFSSVAVDPIEKKPLYYWRPGSEILSLGSLGCTMHCPFCQNHTIAQPRQNALARFPFTEIRIEALVAKVQELGLDAVAYTYNEPALQAEYIIAAAGPLHDAGIATVLVSNGMYSEILLQELARVVDAANIDVKCFNDKTYARMGGALDTMKRSVETFVNAGVHVEATTLVVPGINDSPEEFVMETEWLASISPDIPLHISRYRPAHKHTAPPTDIELLQSFASLARIRLKHVHIGNVPYLRI